MAGHSKWANIKRRKEAVDAKRGKVFTRLLREVTVAARLGGGDPDANPRLRAAIQDAKASNVPNENMERAIKKGTGELEGQAYEEVTYEGYGPGGIAILVEATTDNRNRTAAEIRHLFSRHGGGLGESGCVAWMFEQKGFFVLEVEGLSEDNAMELAMELGAEDMTFEEGQLELVTPPTEYAATLDQLEQRALTVTHKALAQMPTTTVPAGEGDAGERALRLVDALEEHDDVSNVWSNAELEPEAEPA